MSAMLTLDASSTHQANMTFSSSWAATSRLWLECEAPSQRRQHSALQIALVAARHGLVTFHVGIERVEILGAADAAQRVAAGRDQVAAAGRVQPAAKLR